MSSNSSSDKIFNKSRSTRGEALTPCSDKEWDASDEAYGAELLNVKKKPNRVNVFSASEKPVNAVVVQEEFSPKGIEPEHVEFHSLARLIHKTCLTMLNTSTCSKTSQLHIKIEFPDYRNE